MKPSPKLLVLNQMAGPMTWELVEDFAERVGPIALLTGHPDTLSKPPVRGLTVDPASPYHRGSYFRRVLSWMAYIVQAFRWSRRWSPDVPVLVFSNPPLAPWLAYLLKKIQGRRYFVMIHDVYPDLLVELEKMRSSNPIASMWRGLNRAAYENAERVLTLGDRMADRIGDQMEVSRTPAKIISVVPPWADTEKIKPLPKEENDFARTHGLLNKTVVMYSGNMGHGHDIETILEAARRLRSREELHFMFIGAGPKWSLVEDAIRSEDFPNVTLLGWQAEEVLPYSLAAADVAVVSIEKGVEGISIPSKAFSFLAAGVPILLLSQRNSELAALIEQNQCGWIAEPGSVEGFLDVLDAVLECPLETAAFQRNSRQTGTRLGSRKNSEAIIELLCGDAAPPSPGGLR